MFFFSFQLFCTRSTQHILSSREKIYCKDYEKYYRKKLLPTNGTVQLKSVLKIQIPNVRTKAAQVVLYVHHSTVQ